MALTFEALATANKVRCESAFGHKVEDWTHERWSNAMAGEAGETCNAVKKLNRYQEGTNTLKDPPTEEECINQILEEAADTVIYADLLAQKCGKSLAEAVIAKFNKVSELRHCPIRIE